MTNYYKLAHCSEYENLDTSERYKSFVDDPNVQSMNISHQAIYYMLNDTTDTPLDMVSFTVKKRFKVFSDSKLEVYEKVNNMCKYAHTVGQINDVISDIKCNVPFDVSLNDVQELDVSGKEYIVCNMPYVCFKINLYFDENNVSEELELSYRATIFNTTFRRKLQSVKELITSTHKYEDGTIVST